MGDGNLTIRNIGPAGTASRSFEANSKPLETTTMGINFDKSNDYKVPLKFGGEDGTTVYLRPDQVDAMKMALVSATKNEVFAEGTPSVSVSVNGKTYNTTAQDLQSQLSGQGVLTAGS